jgi:putative transposase
MSEKRYTEEFKIEAVRQVVERGHSIVEVASRLGTTTHSLYAWKNKYGANSGEHQAKIAEQVEIRQLKKELKRVTEERDILKKAAAYFAELHSSGYYAWLQKPRSKRAVSDERLSGLIKQFWLESGGVYGYRKIYSDLREHGEHCGENRVYRLMRAAGLRAQVGYRRPRHTSGVASIIAPNRLQRQFNTATPNEAWVTDITHIRTHEGWLYLAVVLDLFSRKIIGWSMQSRITKEVVLDALLMAVWRRNPTSAVTVHSDQGSQYTSHDWQSFLKTHGLEGSMSRRGNCHDNAVAESFFQLLKRERIRRKIYTTRNEARSDVFDYIEVFYNTRRRHGSNNQLSPVEYEERYQQRLASI